MTASSATSRSIHPSAWNRNSQKSMCKILHSSHLSGREKGEHPGPTHSSQHYMLWCWIKIHVSGCLHQGFGGCLCTLPRSLGSKRSRSMSETTTRESQGYF